MRATFKLQRNTMSEDQTGGKKKKGKCCWFLHLVCQLKVVLSHSFLSLIIIVINYKNSNYKDAIPQSGSLWRHLCRQIGHFQLYLDWQGCRVRIPSHNQCDIRSDKGDHRWPSHVKFANGLRRRCWSDSSQATTLGYCRWSKATSYHQKLFLWCKCGDRCLRCDWTRILGCCQRMDWDSSLEYAWKLFHLSRW